MEALPFPQYTRRDGVLNLAKYFPREYVPPDLGPKMYNACEGRGRVEHVRLPCAPAVPKHTDLWCCIDTVDGRQSAWSGMDPKTKKGGHTNLHCDVADAVNVMVDVAVDEDKEESGDENDEKLLLHDDELGDLGKQHGGEHSARDEPFRPRNRARPNSCPNRDVFWVQLAIHHSPHLYPASPQFLPPPLNPHPLH